MQTKKEDILLFSAEEIHQSLLQHTPKKLNHKQNF